MNAFLVAMVVFGAEPSGLAGRWRDGDRESVVELQREADGSWKGVIVSGKHAGDVGKTVFPRLTWDDAKGEWAGPMVKPDDDQRVNVTVKLKDPQHLDALAKVFIFSKTLHFVRVEAAAPKTGP